MLDIVLDHASESKSSPFFHSKESLRDWATALLAKADVQVGGDRPWDIQVHDQELWHRVAGQGTLGLGESYMEGGWDCAALDQFFDRVLSAQLHTHVKMRDLPLLPLLRDRLFNAQSKSRSLEVAEHHYNLGNEFYAAMLDPHMQYTCAYYGSGAKNLEEAQEAKLHLVCRKLDLRPGEKVLELGCGWGGFARFAARHYGAEVEAYNISTEQVAWAREHSQGLPITYHLRDYREASGIFDKVVSIGMCEHVGPRNLSTFFTLAHACLRPGGLFLMHSIGSTRSIAGIDSWIDRYVFPGAHLPSPGELGQAMEGLFVLEDWHNFGADYDRTLMDWQKNFETAWPRFAPVYGERFYRMWRYYLLSCAGSFRSRYNQLYQLVLSKGGERGGWKAVR